MHSFAGILALHSEEVVDERLLAITDGRIVLRIGISGELLDRFGRLTLIEHEVVEGLRIALVAFSLIRHRQSLSRGCKFESCPERTRLRKRAPDHSTRPREFDSKV